MTKAFTILSALGIASLAFAPIAAPAASSDAPVTIGATSVQPADDSRSDRTFHPDYSNALTPAQMSLAWQAEIDRLFPPVMAGGG
jgi:hypothetical protein